MEFVRVQSIYIPKTKENFQGAIAALIEEPGVHGSLTTADLHKIKDMVTLLIVEFIDIPRERVSFRLGLTEKGRLDVLPYGELARLLSPFKGEQLSHMGNEAKYKRIW